MDKSPKKLPHETLIAYAVAVELLTAVREAGIADPKLRDQALRAAKSACLNIAEAAGRQKGNDQRRVYTIARAEACEAAAAVHIAEIAHECHVGSSDRASVVANRLYSLLMGLIRAAKPHAETQSATQPETDSGSATVSDSGTEPP